MAFKMCSNNGVYVLLLVAMAGHLTVAGKFENCQTFIPIPEHKQNRNPDSLKNLTSRPLGYDSAVIPFNDPNKHDPCFVVHLNDSKSQTIQVMAHGVNSNPNFCVQSDLPGDQATCQAGLSTCKDSAIGGSNNVVKYVFFCNGCETDITFWYRFVVSPSFTNGLDFEQWCARIPDEFPNSLIVFPGGETPTTIPTSTANGLTMSWSLLSSFILYFLYML